MLRITCLPSEESVQTLKVEGRIAGQWVEELARVAIRARPRAPRLSLDLSDVTFVDQNGIDLLRTLEDGGVELMDGTGLVRTLLNGGVR